MLAEVITRTAARGGVVVIPSFAVGRAQTILHHLARLKAAKRIPDLPVYLNSPMAIDATQLYSKHAGEHRLSAAEIHAMCIGAQAVNTPEESRRLNTMKGPMIIISASGMATGGRVLHHITQFGPDPRNTLLFADFQAGGTRGAAIMGGAQSVKIHGEYVPIRAEVAMLDTLSSHADSAEILAWLRHLEKAPKTTFLVHGEPAAADALRHQIEEQLHWRVTVPEYLETAHLR
jgi:metallo-beta-lactamase family protein